MKLYIETVGCQMNMLDSELVVASLRKEGYELTATPADADTIHFLAPINCLGGVNGHAQLVAALLDAADFPIGLALDFAGRQRPVRRLLRTRGRHRHTRRIAQFWCYETVELCVQRQPQREGIPALEAKRDIRRAPCSINEPEIPRRALL